MKPMNLKPKTKISPSRKKSKASRSQEISTLDESGMYPVHATILDNDLGMLEHLINTGAKLNQYNMDKDTPLLLAVKNNNYQIVEKLLEEGADSYKKDANQRSPLEVATNLDYQECIDILTEHEVLRSLTAHKNGAKNEKDDSLEFVTALTRLLNNEISNSRCSKRGGALGCQVLALLQQYLNIGGIAEDIVAKLNIDITNRVTQFISCFEHNAKIFNKDILNLSRKIIGIIQDCKKSLPANMEWTLSKIESLIEEKIVLSHAESQKAESHIFIHNTVKQEIVGLQAKDEDWYVRNGYKDFDEFIRIQNLGTGSLKFMKFSNIIREKVLQKTHCRSTESMELVTIKPLKISRMEEFSLLLQDGLKRIKEEETLFLDSQSCKTVLDKAKNLAILSLDESQQLDKILRPGKHHKMHIVHFHHTNKYEPFWDDLTKEAFITGATIHLFNPASKSTKLDLIYFGMAIINKLLDEDVHPDKIILQSYGDGYEISKEVKNQFQKRGIELTLINYQHPSFCPSYYPDFICDNRHMHIYEQTSHKQNIFNKENNPQEFSKFVKHIAEHLAKLKYDRKMLGITSTTSEHYSLTQLINSFITASQNFLKNHVSYKNPVLPDERVENILGMADI
jgi:ankyrin repeat protein